jgi:hypothetical protein
MRTLAPIAAGSILACTLDVACEGLLVRSLRSHAFRTLSISTPCATLANLSHTPLYASQMNTQIARHRHFLDLGVLCFRCTLAYVPDAFSNIINHTAVSILWHWLCICKDQKVHAEIVKGVYLPAGSARQAEPVAGYNVWRLNSGGCILLQWLRPHPDRHLGRPAALLRLAQHAQFRRSGMAYNGEQTPCSVK